MTSREVLAGSAIAVALLLAACHKDETADAPNAAASSSNLADTNANDEMMDEDMGNQAAANSG